MDETLLCTRAHTNFVLDYLPLFAHTNHLEKRAPCVETFENSHERQTHMKTCKRDSRRAQSTRGMRRRCQDPAMAAQQRSVEGNYNAPAAGVFSARRQQQQQQQQLPMTTTTLCARKESSSSSSSPLLCSHASGIEPGPQQTPIDNGEHCRHFEDVGDVGDVALTSRDARVACSNCNRRFSSERVGVHQEICERVNTEENRERHIRTKKGVGSSVRSATQRPHRSASGYGAARRRRRAQEVPPGREHNQAHRDFGDSERLVCTYRLSRMWKLMKRLEHYCKRFFIVWAKGVIPMSTRAVQQ